MSTCGLGQLVAQERGGLEAIGAGHLDVEHGDVGAMLARGVHDRVAVVDLGDDLHVLLEADEGEERAADQVLVLGDQDADHAGHPRRAGGSARPRADRSR